MVSRVTRFLPNVHADCLFSFSFFQFSARRFVYGILRAWSGLNSLICGRLVPGVRRVRDDCFQRTSQADRQIPPRAALPVNSTERQHARPLCVIRREIDFCVHLVCPSLLCFKAQFRERPYDVLTRACCELPSLKKMQAHKKKTHIAPNGLLPLEVCCRSGHVLVVR